MKHLILGGARSGKSRYAEQQALQHAEKNYQHLWYVATATRGDDEMVLRIQEHQARRGEQWQLIEEPVDLVSQLNRLNSEDNCVLIDCLTLWLSNILIAEEAGDLGLDWKKIKPLFLQALTSSRASVFMVSNEVGSGIVPMGELSRQFVDESGWLHQDLAATCDQVTLVTAGLPLALKQ